MVDVFKLSSTDLVTRFEREFSQMMGGADITSLIPWQDMGIDAPANGLDGAFLRGLSFEQRRDVFDKILDISMLQVYEGNTEAERTTRHLAIQPEAREAKWHYMLALANDTFGMGLDYVDLEILAPLYRQLSEVERGATNVHMPTTCKIRHNPSIHSLHVAGLIYEMQQGAMAAAGERPDAEALKGELAGFGQQMMRAALVHDMGELEGELSVANDRKGFTAAELAAFEANRGLSETEIFQKAIDARLHALEARTWPKDMLDSKREQFHQAYAFAEESEHFSGRAHKTAERIQTQQDYLRFEGKDFAPPLHVVPQYKDDHKGFMAGYALAPLLGEYQGAKDKPALRDLVDHTERGLVQQLMCAEIENCVEALQTNIIQRLRVEPEPAGKDFRARIAAAREQASQQPQR